MAFPPIAPFQSFPPSAIVPDSHINSAIPPLYSAHPVESQAQSFTAITFPPPVPTSQHPESLTQRFQFVWFEFRFAAAPTGFHFKAAGTDCSQSAWKRHFPFLRTKLISTILHHNLRPQCVLCFVAAFFTSFPSCFLYFAFRLLLTGYSHLIQNIFCVFTCPITTRFVLEAWNISSAALAC